MRYPFVPTINLRRLRIPVLSLTLFAHCYPSQTLLWLKIYQKLFSTHMHNWLSILLKETRVFAKFEQFLPVRSHFDTKRPVHFFSHSNFPIPYLWTAFCVPLSFVFFTKNNNLELIDFATLRRSENQFSR